MKKSFKILSIEQADLMLDLITTIDISFAELYSAFGAPSYLKGEGLKVDAVWNLDTEQFGQLTIYNYGDGINHLGDSGLLVTQIRNWRVGSSSFEKHDGGEVSAFIYKCIEESVRDLLKNIPY